MQQASGYAWVYGHMAGVSKRWGDTLTVGAGFLGAALGAEGLASVVSDGDVPLWARLFQFVLGALIAVAASLATVWRLSETFLEAMAAQAGFEALAHDILWQLAQPRRDRPDAHGYLRDKFDEFARLRAAAPRAGEGSRRAYAAQRPDTPLDGEGGGAWLDAFAGAARGSSGSSSSPLNERRTPSVFVTGSARGSPSGSVSGSPSGSVSGSVSGSESGSPSDESQNTSLEIVVIDRAVTRV